MQNKFEINIFMKVFLISICLLIYSEFTFAQGIGTYDVKNLNEEHARHTVRIQILNYLHKGEDKILLAIKRSDAFKFCLTDISLA